MNLVDTCEGTVHDDAKIRLIPRQNERQGPVRKRSRRPDLGSPQEPANRVWTFVSGSIIMGYTNLDQIKDSELALRTVDDEYKVESCIVSVHDLPSFTSFIFGPQERF